MVAWNMQILRVNGTTLHVCWQRHQREKVQDNFQDTGNGILIRVRIFQMW